MPRFQANSARRRIWISQLITSKISPFLDTLIVHQTSLNHPITLPLCIYESPQGPNLSRPDPPMDYAPATTRVRNPSNQLFSSVQNMPKKLNISSSVTATMSPPVGALPNSNASPSQFDFRYPQKANLSPGSLFCVTLLNFAQLSFILNG